MHDVVWLAGYAANVVFVCAEHVRDAMRAREEVNVRSNLSGR